MCYICKQNTLNEYFWAKSRLEICILVVKYAMIINVLNHLMCNEH